MTRPTVATGSGADAAASVEASVRLACLAAGLLVAQLVAAKATRDALFLSNFRVTALPIASGLTVGLSLAGVLAFSAGLTVIRLLPPLVITLPELNTVIETLRSVIAEPAPEAAEP